MISKRNNNSYHDGTSVFFNVFSKKDPHLNVVETLKVVSATFLLVCFVCLKGSTCKTRKNSFYFTSKALLVLEIINFQHFRYSNVMTSSNAQSWNTKHILLNNLGSKCSLVMKFGQFMQYYKIIFLSKNPTKNVARKLVPSPF